MANRSMIALTSLLTEETIVSATVDSSAAVHGASNTLTPEVVLIAEDRPSALASRLPGHEWFDVPNSPDIPTTNTYIRHGGCVYALRPPLSVEDTPSGRVPFTYHFSYERLPFRAEHCCVNGSLGPLDVLPAGGTLRSPFYRLMREHLGLPTDHLFEIVDPRHPDEPLLLDLSGSLQVMCAHREEENPRCWTDKRVVHLRGVTQAGEIIHGHRKRATVTLGWVDLEFPYYWGTSNRMVLMIERDRETVLPDKTRLTVPLEEFLSLCGWPPAAEAKANHYRSEFEAGRVPTFAESEAMIRFPPSENRGVYGVYTVVDGVAQSVDLADDDTMCDEYRKGLGLAKASLVRSKFLQSRWFDPITLEPDPRLWQIAPIWQDKDDCRPWAVVLGLNCETRWMNYSTCDWKDMDRALAERRRIYGKRAQDVLTRGSIDREKPVALVRSADAAPVPLSGRAGKRGRNGSAVPAVVTERRLSPRGTTSSTVSVPHPVPAQVSASSMPDLTMQVGRMPWTEEATKQLHGVAALLRASVPDGR
eukprot:gene32324-41886_t